MKVQLELIKNNSNSILVDDIKLFNIQVKASIKNHLVRNE